MMLWHQLAEGNAIRRVHPIHTELVVIVVHKSYPALYACHNGRFCLEIVCNHSVDGNVTNLMRKFLLVNGSQTRSTSDNVGREDHFVNSGQDYWLIGMESTGSTADLDFYDSATFRLFHVVLYFES